jgi:ferric-dicitrate binding protein FerR (iron transport regulator)
MEKNLASLLQKYQEGKLGLNEEILLAERLADASVAETSILLKKDLQQHLEGPQNEKADLKHVLNEIHHRIHLKQSAKKKDKIYQLYRWASQVAAVLFVPVLVLSLFLLLNKKTPDGQFATLEIIAPKGARVNFELPDGTTGFLNSGSTLNYSSAFAHNRHLQLSGEAYFDVAHDQSHPFIIEANKNVIQVVGTKFNLTAYPSETNTELVLEEGKVLFKSPAMKSAVDLLPGQRLTEKNGKVELEEVETWKYSAWKEGKLVFRNDSMKELARRISLWYNVDVDVDDSGLEAYTFRGVFEDDPLEEVLRLLKMTSPIDYKIYNRQENTDGTFGRKKVVITKNN